MTKKPKARHPKYSWNIDRNEQNAYGKPQWGEQQRKTKGGRANKAHTI